MKDRQDKAQEAIEFILITVLVFFGALFTVVVFGDKMANFFTGDSSVAKNANASAPVINPKANMQFINDYETTVQIDDEQSRMACTNGVCVLKVGDVVISDIPENFNNYVSTSGSSGGTETISKIYKSIADALSEQGLTSESEKIKELSSMASNIAVVEHVFEGMVNSCNGNETCIRSLDSKLNDTFPKPASYDETYSKFPQGATYNDMLYSGCFGEASSDSEFINRNINLAVKYLDKLQEIKSEANVSKEVKSVIDELSWSIGTIGEDFEDNYNL